MPRRKSGKMLQLGDYSFYAPVARGPSISPAAPTRAFNKTQNSTTDIVSKAGFIGYTEAGLPQNPRDLPHLHRRRVSKAQMRHPPPERGPGQSPRSAWETTRRWRKVPELHGPSRRRRLGINQTRPRRQGAPPESGRDRALLFIKDQPPARAPRPHAHLHGRAPLGVVVRADGPRPRPHRQGRGQKGPWRNCAPTTAPAPPFTASWRTSSAASSTRTTLRGRTLTLGGEGAQRPRAGRRGGRHGEVARAAAEGQPYPVSTAASATGSTTRRRASSRT
ncbi:hypothetical protein CTRI78_v002314 [Colletotrichum trifolii]|uniref:Uncharacterized protein n=1 Tax=Colletotrichum trifolii TaxID=5466 RepID=A0A4V3HX50_COLTR|nr:hypothetical protein CTRI78_v002314 [Colletotrichum trifolii]